jgi:hypothetical protein
MYLGKYDPQSDSYITTNIFNLGKYTDLNLNTISDDMIEVQASDCIFTIYRGHPYIKINHVDEDIAIDTIFTRIWAEQVGNNPSEDLPVYYDLMNDHNLLPSGVGGDNTIRSDDITLEEIIDEGNTDTNLKWYTGYTPSTTETDTDITFRVLDTSYNYTDEVFIEGSDCSFGTYTWNQESDGVARTIDITPSKQIMQSGDTSKLYSKVTDGTNGVSGLTVEFLQYNPLLFYYEGRGGFEVDSWIVQSDGSLVSDDTGSTFSGVTGTGWFWANLYGTSTALQGDYFNEFEVEFDVISTTANAYLGIYESYATDSTGQLIKLKTGHNKVVKSGDIMKHYVDDELDATYTKSLTEPVRIGFSVYKDNNAKIKNFIIGGY